MCNITVTLAEKRSNSIFVQGTSDCNEVSIQLLRPGATPLIAAVDNNGNWEVTFTSSEVPGIDSIPCPETIKTEIHCNEDASCKGPADIQLICEGTTCPSITISLSDISNCDSNGQRIASFNININNAPVPTVLEISYGDGTDEIISNSEIVGSGGSISKQHHYNSGNYSIVVQSVFPEGCPNSNILNVDIPKCDAACPDDVEFEIIDSNGNRYKSIDNIAGPYQQINDNPNNDHIECLQNGNYVIKIISPNNPGLGITWREDENPPITTNQPDYNVQLNSGEEKSITVTLVKENCPPLSETIILKTCGCEETEWSEWSECVDCTQTRTRTLSDCSEETETRRCSATPTEWSEWSNVGFCSQRRSRTNENCQTEEESRIDWCCIFMWVTIGLISLTAIFILVTPCMLPTTFWSAVAALGSGGTLSAVTAVLTTANVVMLIISLVLLGLSIIVLLIWLIVCVFMNGRDAACYLLSIFIAVMSWLTAVSAIIAIILSIIAFLCAVEVVCLFQALGCALGAWIDVAWFGTILSIAVIIQSFLCGED